MKIAIYARVSTDRQVEEGVSLDGQIKQITAWSESQKHTIVEKYIEKGASATDDRRPEFQRMIQDAVSMDHPFDAIVVFALSRFFRDAIALGTYERKLVKHKVQLISITQPTSEDEAGQMVRQIISAFDEYSSRENGKNVRRSMVENAKQGYFNGSKAKFGYVPVRTEVKGRSGYKRKLEIEQDEAEIVRLTFRLAIKGTTGEPFGIMKISAFLNTNGYLHRGKEWRRQAVWEILSSSIYYGDCVYNRIDSRSRTLRPESEWVITKVPPIISREEFDLAAALRGERAPGGTKHQSSGVTTLLTGLAKCSLCGAGFVLVSGKGGQYDYYRCSTRQYKGTNMCEAPNIPREELDRMVLQTVATTVLDPDRVRIMLDEMRNKIAEIQKPERDREKHLQRQNALLTEQINNWYELIESGKVELHKSLHDRLAATQKLIDSQALELSQIAMRRQIPLKKFGEQQIKTFVEAFRTEVFSPNSKFAKSYLKAVVSEIRIKGDKGTIGGRNADMAATISSYRAGAPLVVPRHLSNWCPEPESNRYSR